MGVWGGAQIKKSGPGDAQTGNEGFCIKRSSKNILGFWGRFHMETSRTGQRYGANATTMEYGLWD